MPAAVPTSHVAIEAIRGHFSIKREVGRSRYVPCYASTKAIEQIRPGDDTLTCAVCCHIGPQRGAVSYLLLQG